LFVLGATLGATTTLVGCGTEDGIEVKHAFLNWNPSAALVAEHTQWHTGGCGQPGARLCPDGPYRPRSGAEFLTFHRNFLDRLRDDAESKGIAASELTPWRTFPDDLKATAVWRDNGLSDIEAHIEQMVNGSTEHFSTLEEFGSFLELNIHNFLHPAAAAAYPADTIGPVEMSPKSTYFFKIHGWVEWQFQRFQRGDFNRDGYSDIVIRNTSTGANQLQYIIERSPSTATTLPTMSATDGCQWYVGATPDLNYDGNPDIVWHGPGCKRTVLWTISSSGSRTSTVELAAADSNLELIGAGDFNNDMRPDLVWRRKDNNKLVFWRMNNTAKLESIEKAVPAGFTPAGVADASAGVNGSVGGTPDIFMWQLSGGNRAYSWLNMSSPFTTGSTQSMGFSTSTSATLGGTGRWSPTNSVFDMIFNGVGANTVSFSFAMKTSPTTYSGLSGGSLGGLPMRIQGPR
jgi:hypothetical protein